MAGGLYAWELEKDGRELNVRVDGPLIINDERLAIRAAIDGHGLVMAMEDLVRGAIAEGSLIRVLDDWCKPFQGYHLYYPDRSHPSPAFAALVSELRRPEKDEISQRGSEWVDQLQVCRVNRTAGWSRFVLKGSLCVSNRIRDAIFL